MDQKNRKLPALLGALALAAGCGFQFTNPVEKCPGSGCPDDGVVDGGHDLISPDAGLADGGSEFTIESPWQTEVIFDDGSGKNRFIKAALGFASNDPFFVFSEMSSPEANEPMGHLSRRKDGQWSDTALGPFYTMGDIQLHALASATTPSFFMQNCDELHFLQWNDGLGELDDYLLRKNFELGCSSVIQGALRTLASRDEAGVSRFVRVVDGTLTLLTWDGRLDEVTLSSETVTQAAQAVPVALELGPSGNLHVFYSEQSAGLAYGVRDSNGWQHQVVREEFQTNWLGSASAVDAQDQPIFCFASPGTLSGSYSLQCLRLRGGVWESEFVRANTRSTIFMVDGLEVDSSNRVHLVYRENLQLDDTTGRYSLHHAVLEDAEWTDTTIVQTEGSWTNEIGGVAFALDSQDRPHVGFGVHGRYLHATPPASE